MIIDLIWPLGSSVNSGVSSDKYLSTDLIVLTYPSTDNITDQVLQLGRGCKMFKVDISHAFCHVPIDQRDLDLLGLYWGGTISLIFCCLSGSNTGLPFFQRISDQVWNYIDDFLCISLPSKN